MSVDAQEEFMATSRTIRHAWNTGAEEARGDLDLAAWVAAVGIVVCILGSLLLVVIEGRNLSNVDFTAGAGAEMTQAP